MFVIYWESKITLAKVNGTKKVPLDQAKEIVKMANKEFPTIKHWYKREPLKEI